MKILQPAPLAGLRLLPAANLSFSIAFFYFPKMRCINTGGQPRGKYSSSQGPNLNDDWKRLSFAGGATPARDPRTNRTIRPDFRARTGRSVCRLVGHGEGRLG